MIIGQNFNTSFLSSTKIIGNTDIAEQVSTPGLQKTIDSDRPEIGIKESASTQQQSLSQSSSEETTSNNSFELKPEELEIIRDLAHRDRDVRAHEQAHAAVGGAFTGAPSYETTRGPDGRQYAVSGEVSIDVSAISGNPEATLRKAEIIRRAALAPAEPSQQDRAVAALATQLTQQARLENAQQSSDEIQQAGESDKTSDTDSEQQAKIENNGNELSTNLQISRAAERVQKFETTTSSRSSGELIDQFA